MSISLATRASHAAVLGVIAALAGGCGGEGCDGDDPPAPPSVHDAQVQLEPAPALRTRAVGMAALADFAYSRGAGRSAFRRALTAFANSDWSAAEAGARKAVAADPRHLEAQWLLARSLAAQERFDLVGDSLAEAAAGDWLRWGARSLEGDEFRTFRESRWGEAYRKWAEAGQAAAQLAARDGAWVVGRRGRPWRARGPGDSQVNHRAEVYAYDPAAKRYVRLTRTGGAVVGFVRRRGTGWAAYVAYRKVHLPDEAGRAAGQRPYLRSVRIGTIDATEPSVGSSEVVFENVWALELFFSDSDAKSTPTLMARTWGISRTGTPAAKPTIYRINPSTGERTVLPRRTPVGDRLRVTYEAASWRRSSVPGVAADWDEGGQAGAFRLERTGKTITVPGGRNAARDSMRWSDDMAELAFATASEDECADLRAARSRELYLVDATTGRLRSVGQGERDFAPSWLDQRTLAYVASLPTGRTAVVLYDVESESELQRLEGEAGVGTQWLPGGAECEPGGVAHGGDEPADGADGDEGDWEEWEDDDGVGTPARAGSP